MPVRLICPASLCDRPRESEMTLVLNIFAQGCSAPIHLELPGGRLFVGLSSFLL
jgi:hypothetical protein